MFLRFTKMPKTPIVNRMHSVAHRHHLQHERGKRFNEKNTLWQKDRRLSKVEQFQLELEMENRAYVEKLEASGAAVVVRGLGNRASRPMSAMSRWTRLRLTVSPERSKEAVIRRLP